MHCADDEEAVDAARHAAVQAFEQASPQNKKSKAIKISKVGPGHECPVWLVAESASAYTHDSETHTYMCTGCCWLPLLLAAIFSIM